MWCREASSNRKRLLAYQNRGVGREGCNSMFCFCFFCGCLLFEGNWVSLMGFSLTSWAGIDGDAPYQAQELQITTLANPWIQTNFLPPRPVQS